MKLYVDKHNGYKVVINSFSKKNQGLRLTSSFPWIMSWKDFKNNIKSSCLNHFQGTIKITTLKTCGFIEACGCTHCILSGSSTGKVTLDAVGLQMGEHFFLNEFSEGKDDDVFPKNR